ncbi:hypothetical protein GH714_037629 [Hevea brasiliensis]|uniref:Pectinesterase n=1 Tax=Hevea brasiliensis TaxID=3981 RepID=A0A6A6MR23_HEVBR|nr:hypothetical protein GH714_037629 [Hevea brasiliensis]
MYEVRVSSSNCRGIRKKLKKPDKIENVALNDCLELFSDTIDELTLALSDLSPKTSPSKHYHDLQTLLSAAMTNQYTCLDGFAYSKGKVRKTIKTSLYNISRHVSNSLVMLKKIPGVNASIPRLSPTVVGNGFIAKGITFENSAGPSKHQAVALRSGSDFSAFYQCSFVGYQDTLYVHSLRQFYRECDIYGTIDFIFGNAAVVFQNCNLYARKPNQNQKNIFTAQGREDPNQNTGISIINSKVTAAADLIPVKSSFNTYLGRPWKQYPDSFPSFVY